MGSSIDTNDGFGDKLRKNLAGTKFVGTISDSKSNVINIFGNGKMFDKSMSIGYRLFYEGNYVESAKYFKKAVELFPENIDANLQLGITLILLGEFDDSLEYLNKIIESKRKTDVLYYIGLCYKNKGEFLIALEYANRAITINPYEYEFFLLKGIILYDLGKYKDAILFLDKVIKLNPICEEAYYYKGLCFHNLQMYREAANM